MSHSNNFQALRYLAATLVIVAHGYELQNTVHLVEPFKRLTGLSLGSIGVNVFFSISGYLIMQSLIRSPHLPRFVAARALRIFPGLIVCIAVTIFAAAAITTIPTAQYFTSHLTLNYFVGNASLISMHYELPGVFEINPYPRAVNGSLWTLQYEIGCYSLAAILLMTGLLSEQRRVAIIFALVLACAVYQATTPWLPTRSGPWVRVDHSTRLFLCFGLGMLIAATGGRVRGLHAGVALALCAGFSGTPLFKPFLCAFIAASTLWLAFVQWRGLKVVNRLPDYSYGVYIYAFPIQQGLMRAWPDLNPTTHIAFALALVLVPAGLSWHFIEKPALALKPKSRPHTVAAVA